jgi:hypothetical protein
MKYAVLSAVVIAGLLFADSAANAQVVIGGGYRGVGIGVGIGGGYYVPPPPVYYAAPAVVYPGAYVAPAPVVVSPSVSVGVAAPFVIGGPLYRPYYAGYYRPYYRYHR